MPSFTKSALLASAMLAATPTHVAAQDSGIDALQAQLEQMQAEMEQLKTELEALKAQQAEAAAAPAPAPVAVAAAPQDDSDSTEIVFKGAPQIESEGGWSFKPRGRLMYDAGFTDVPDTTGRDEGFANEARRVRLGIQGDVPGGFGYKLEVDFADDDIDVTDAIISYETGDLDIAVGQQNHFQSLAELTSSLHESFIERPAFTDAFGFERRIGVSASYSSGIFLGQAGIYTDNFENTDTDNYGFAGRVVAMPKFGNAQAHFGATLDHNVLAQDGSQVRYRQRPLVHFTSERFVNTGGFSADSETGYGLEAAVIAGRLHAVAEGYWRSVDRPGNLSDPSFFGSYAEIGYFLTPGDTRGYKSGKFDRVKPSRPLGDGGFGSVQVNLRYDHLDLTDDGIVGGTQDGYFASVIWKPTAYTLLMMNYGRLLYDDAFYPTITGNTSYGVDAFAVRAQIDF